MVYICKNFVVAMVIALHDSIVPRIGEKATPEAQGLRAARESWDASGTGFWHSRSDSASLNFLFPGK